MKVFKLNFEDSVDVVVLFDWWYLNGHLNEGFLFFSNFESNLFEVLEPFVAPDRKNIFIEGIKFSVAALSDNPEHERIGGGVFIDDLFPKVDGNINFFDGARKES